MDPLNYKKALKNDKVLISVLQSFSGQMLKIAYSFHNNKDFADEVIASTVYKVYKYRKKVKKPEYFKTWVMRILINECKTELKKRNEFLEIKDINFIRSSSSDDYSFMVEYLKKLTEEEQEIIYLKIYNGFTFKEIAEIFSSPESTIKSKYYAVLEKLRIEMEDVYEF